MNEMNESKMIFLKRRGFCSAREKAFESLFREHLACYWMPSKGSSESQPFYSQKLTSGLLTGVVRDRIQRVHLPIAIP